MQRHQPNQIAVDEHVLSALVTLVVLAAILATTAVLVIISGVDDLEPMPATPPAEWIRHGLSVETNYPSGAPPGGYGTDWIEQSPDASVRVPPVVEQSDEHPQSEWIPGVRGSFILW
jgi:hypothetical protein